MKEFIRQVESSLDHGLYYVALMSALTIPDMAAALESSDGTTNGEKYQKWYEKWVQPEIINRRIKRTGAPIPTSLPEEMNSTAGMGSAKV